MPGTLPVQQRIYLRDEQQYDHGRSDQASGGQITITAPEIVRLINSLISTSVAGSTEHHRWQYHDRPAVRDPAE